LSLPKERRGCGVREKNQAGEGATVWFEISLGLGFFLCFFLSTLPPLFCVLWRPVFIGKNIARFPNLVPQLLSFFVNLIFLIFLDFSYQHRLEMRKIDDFKNNAFKVESVPKSLKFKFF
jgi:hypothetical protein